MRILIVSQYYWPEHFRINDLAEGLVERGHHVTVLTGCPNYPGGDIFNGYGFFNKSEIQNGVKIFRVPLIPRGTGSSIRLAMNYLSFMVTATLLGPFLCRGSIDLIFVCQLSPVTVGIPAAFLKRLKGAPIVFWVLDLWPESIATSKGLNNTWLYKAINFLVCYIYRQCDRILYTSKGFALSIQSRGVDPSKLSYFPNWVEAQPNPHTENLAPLPNGFRVMFAGNIGESQDFGMILAAAELLKTHANIQWIILGEGRQWAWVKEQVEKRGLGNCFHLLGRFPADSMSGFFKQADALLVTLKKEPAFSMTVPGKVPSYMSCGKPILAALDGEGASLIREANAGFVVPSGDSQALAESVMKMSLLPLEERIQMGLSAQQFCNKHFDREFLFTNLEILMGDVVQTSHSVSH